ncbi:MAG: hypothetical protein OMM_01596 [Candidatus Magnetoglobus multicellularis str. Araruama]|uniref:DUF1156 domain-containing protein n=1 Tax=Candidatus Magnetoglobus multicellularis str. Araruama TaxID=890399 RepID=A0A1V1PCE5_9BACT|nr:MAG: hypothetical protein OMM_01596 [Candidatus Magnetoglobus multicellularis str. Araruama]
MGLIICSKTGAITHNFCRKIKLLDTIELKETNVDLWLALKTCLSLVLNRLADFNSSLCVLNSMGGRGVVHTFGRQALGIVWDYMETNPFNEVGANWQSGLIAFEKNIKQANVFKKIGNSELSNATEHPLPDNSTDIFATDPPYYDAVPYADLSDFFYVWLKRTLKNEYRKLFANSLTKKKEKLFN